MSRLLVTIFLHSFAVLEVHNACFSAEPPATWPRYQGPRPTSDDFIPYGGDINKLEGAQDRRLSHAFRQAMLLNGVDLPGLAGVTMQAHTDADIEQAVNAVSATIELLRDERLV